MKQEIKDRWTAALRSGEYKQGIGQLKVNDTYCCLGVLCDVLGFDLDRARDDEWGEQWAGASGEGPNFPFPLMLRPETRRKLTGLNDNEWRTFPEIADYIDENIPVEP